MKIVAYVHFMMPHHYAGSEVMILNLMKNAQRAGHDVNIIATYEAHSEWVYDGVQCYGETSEFTGFNRLQHLNPDIIITHHHETFAARSYAQYLNIPMVQLIHNNNQHKGRTHPLLDVGADFVIYNTEWVQEWYSDSYTHDSCVVHPPVFPEDHETMSGSKVTLVNLNAHKGAEIFYELARRLPNVEFLGVEGGHGPQLYERWDNVELQLQTTNMRDDVWRKTRLLLMPSIYESYGMVGVEALASGIPVLATPTPGLKESLGDAGIFIDRDNIDHWQHVIEDMLTNDQSYAQQSFLARKRIAELDPHAESLACITQLERVVSEWPMQR